jgi:hypothetical protein
MRYRDYMEMFPSGFRPYSNPQDDSDNVSLPDSERQRLYQESQSTWRDYAANPLSFGATPLSGNIPTFQQWAAGNPEIVGDNSPEYQYLQQFYQLPNKSDIWETVLPMAAMAAVGATAGGAFGNLSTYGSAGGTLGSAAGAAGGAASGGMAAADAAGLAQMAADAGLTGAAADAFVASGGVLGSTAAGGANALGLYQMGADAGLKGGALENFVASGGLQGATVAGGGGVGLGAGSGALSGAAKVGSTLTQPTGNTTFGIPNNILAGGLQGLLGYIGAGQQADAYQDVYNQQSAIGAPYRDRLNASYQPGFDLMSQPGYGDAFNRMAEISTNSWSPRGNPANTPGIQAGVLNDVWSQNYLPALSNYRGQLGQFGGMGLNTAGQSSLMGAQTAGSGLDALGYAAGTMFNPQPNINDIFKQLGGYKINVGGSLFGG